MKVKCKYGKLKNPTGHRWCRKVPRGSKRRVHCKWGKLKSPKGHRVCKRQPGSHWPQGSTSYGPHLPPGGIKAYRRVRVVERNPMSRKVCKYGKLKNPKGRRICRKRPARKSKIWSSESSAHMYGYSRRRRRSRR
jgi:hypothetical protein